MIKHIDEIKKVELKSIHYSERFSEETFCYDAKVYVNGKHAVSVKNDGRGGCDSQYPNISKGFDSSIIKILDEYFKKNSYVAFYGKYDDFKLKLSEGTLSNLETFCQDSVTTYLHKKDMRSSLKKAVVWKDKDNGNIYNIGLNKGSKESIENHLAEKYGLDNIIILNNLDFEDALNIWVENDKSGNFIKLTPVFDGDNLVGVLDEDNCWSFV